VPSPGAHAAARPLPLKKWLRPHPDPWLYPARHDHAFCRSNLSYLEGKIISRTEESHTHIEWLRFLKQIDRETPRELDLHLIVDNYATHKHPTVQRWLQAHRRFHLHFTPTSSSWLNLVERFFGELTADVVREGSFQSARELLLQSNTTWQTATETQRNMFGERLVSKSLKKSEGRQKRWPKQKLFLHK
jgi:transposase